MSAATVAWVVAVTIAYQHLRARPFNLGAESTRDGITPSPR